MKRAIRLYGSDKGAPHRGSGGFPAYVFFVLYVLYVLYVSTLNTDNTLATLLLFYICVHFYENKLMCTFLRKLANVYFVLYVSTYATLNT